jgi:hypothetical protein
MTKLHSLFWLVDYYQSLGPDMRSIRQTLDDIGKSSEWYWQIRCQQAFDTTKAILK